MKTQARMNRAEKTKPPLAEGASSTMPFAVPSCYAYGLQASTVLASALLGCQAETRRFGHIRGIPFL